MTVLKRHQVTGNSPLPVEYSEKRQAEELGRGASGVDRASTKCEGTRASASGESGNRNRRTGQRTTAQQGSAGGGAGGTESGEARAKEREKCRKAEGKGEQMERKNGTIEGMQEVHISRWKHGPSRPGWQAPYSLGKEVSR